MEVNACFRRLSIGGMIALGSSLSSMTVFAAEGTVLPSHLGAEIRGMTSTAGLGVLFGFRYVSFESDTFFVGGGGYTGQLSRSGASAGSFSYGGLEAGFLLPLSSKMEIELSLLAGGGGGFTGTTTVSGGVTLQPCLGLTFVSGKTVRTSVNAGYVWMPNSTDFSGITFGVRLDFSLGGKDSMLTTAR